MSTTDSLREIKIKNQILLNKSGAKVFQYQANQIFKKNLKCLKRYLPELYKKYKLYQPKNKKLFYDTAGFINVMDNGTAVYNEDPKLHSEFQASVFRAYPKRTLCRGAITEDDNQIKHFLHVYFANEIDKLINKQSEIFKAKVTLPKEVDVLMMLGCGLGYQIQELFKHHEIHNFILIEPEDDIFYASLLTIDWAPIIENGRRSGNCLILKIGGVGQDFASIISNGFSQVGMFHLAYMYLYKHYSSNYFDEQMSSLIEHIDQLFKGWGFFDDEIISLAHTLENHKNNPVYLRSDISIRDEIGNIPVFLVGNGPSLDRDFQFIKENQHRAIIVCCACSTLKALYRYDIKPDFLAVMERIHGVTKWVATIEDEQWLRDIILISVNHTHPEVGAKFRRWGIGLKGMDTGSLLISKLLSESKSRVLPYAANTGANTALSFINQWGFKHCYLFGLDLGYKDVKKHHSKMSAYFSEDTEEDLKKYEDSGPRNIVRRGNFGGKVYTESIMNVSRICLEAVLARPKLLTCYNCSDGVEIKGAIPAFAKDIRISQEKIDKAVIINEIFDACFEKVTTDEVEIEDEINDFLKHVDAALEKLVDMLNLPVKTTQDVMQIFYQQTILIDFSAGKYSFATKVLLYGAVKCMQLKISGFIQHIRSCDIDEQQWNEFWGKCKDIFIGYLNACRRKIKTNYKKLDTDMNEDEVVKFLSD